ncbi:MAG TPA: hypothetical protein VGP63_03170 [Planctomycetaceae bacterium]|jgi:hypothetical protein|nr:hypothetical protein [Planctomycetaceae bacterium]
MSLHDNASFFDRAGRDRRTPAVRFPAVGFLIALASGFFVFVLAGAAAVARADDVDQQIAAIASVGPQGQGADRARAACRELSGHGPEVVPRLLAAMDTPNVVAANWYRAAFERVVSRELADPRHRLPVEEFKQFARNQNHSGRARRLALTVVDRLDPTFGPTLIPTLVDDREFRDDAVAVALKQGADAIARGDHLAAKRAFQRAFDHAFSPDQVTAAASKLQSLGEKPSIVEHLGLITDWSVIGPFAAPGMSGFRAVFRPETAREPLTDVTLSDNKTLRWLTAHASDAFGTVDLVKALGPIDEAVAYADAVVETPRDQPAELRCSADDNLSVWLNGEKVFGRDMWLNGTRFDRFRTPVQLRAGRNRVLVKICQGPHHRDPAVGNAWTFQLRFCSNDGAGVPLKRLPPAERTLRSQPSERVTSGK